MFAFVYRLALRAYPRSFRAEYEQEMLVAFDELLVGATGPGGRFWLCLRSLTEVVQWAPRERLEVLNATISATPGVLVWGSASSLSLLAPFVLAACYRLHMLADREPNPQWSALLVHAEPYYERLLPAVALVIIFFSTILFLRNATMKNGYRYFLGLGLIGSLAIVALV
jgi:hypothetical protein